MDICKPNDDVMSHPQTTGHFPLLHVPPPDSNSSSHSTKKLAKSPNNGQYFVHDPYSWWIVCPTVCGSVCNDLLVAQAVLRGHWIQWCASRESPLACSLNYFYFTHNQQHSLVPCIRLVCFVTQWLLSEHWPCMLFDCWWHLVPPSKKKQMQHSPFGVRFPYIAPRLPQPDIYCPSSLPPQCNCLGFWMPGRAQIDCVGR